YTVVGTGFQPEEPVTGTVRPDQLPLGTATADSTGKVTLTATLSEALTEGTHQVVLDGALSGTTEKSFKVTADGSLAATGASPLGLPFVLVGVVAVVLGAVGLGLWRRRREA
ncbi:MAG: hypothetical protein LBS56_09070, partial [Propionibacteriaceae bacterium]|nr:hypothetical protein [Propionibacteriaceae bacterium]